MNPKDYETLLLDGIISPDILEKDRVFLERFTCCIHLSFNSSGLKNLGNFPRMDKLVKLELQDNKIQAGLGVLGERVPNLEVLKVGNNLISSLQEVQKLSLLASLFQLDLVGNPLCELCNYESKVFQVLPVLEVLDGQDRDGNEVVTEEEDGN